MGSLGRFAFALVAALAASGFPQIAGAATSGPARASLGHLKIWVPVGVIRDAYWIYVNGRIASAPPHTETRAHSANFFLVKKQDGWEIWNSRGLVLRTIHDDGWDGRHSPYALDSASREALGLFAAVDLPLRGGKYAVNLAAISASLESSFPFVFTGDWNVDVAPGRTKQLFLQIPEKFVALGAARLGLPNRLCPEAAPPSRVDLDQLRRTSRAYTADPIVTALRSAIAEGSSNRKGVVDIDMPSEQGGSREFDGAQVKAIVDAIAARFDFPTQEDVASCRARYPQFSGAYAAYGKLLADIDKDFQPFRDLAARLGGSR